MRGWPQADCVGWARHRLPVKARPRTWDSTASEVPDGRDAEEGPQVREPEVRGEHQARVDDTGRREELDREARRDVRRRRSTPR